MSESGVVNRITAEGNAELQPVPRDGHESTEQTSIYLYSNCFHVAIYKPAAVGRGNFRNNL